MSEPPQTQLATSLREGRPTTVDEINFINSPHFLIASYNYPVDRVRQTFTRWLGAVRRSFMRRRANYRERERRVLPSLEWQTSHSVVQQLLLNHLQKWAQKTRASAHRSQQAKDISASTAHHLYQKTNYSNRASTATDLDEPRAPFHLTVAALAFQWGRRVDHKLAASPQRHLSRIYHEAENKPQMFWPV